MTTASKIEQNREGVRAHRDRLRAQGLRPVQIWVPDVRAPGFKAQAHSQSQAVAASAQARDDQAFIDAVSDWNEE
ncbi:MAG: antitoxin MazE family protein [Burkholderiaceae bacterium]